MMKANQAKQLSINSKASEHKWMLEEIQKKARSGFNEWRFCEHLDKSQIRFLEELGYDVDLRGYRNRWTIVKW